jgi:mutator protein MutT
MKHIDVAIGVVVRSGKVLVCRRKNEDTFGGFWEFPGGKCEAGETLEACLARELREEVDLVVQLLDKLQPLRHNYPHVSLTLHPFWCRHLAGEPKLIECQEARWVEPAELKTFKFPPANESILIEIERRLKTNHAAPLPG